MAGQADLQGGAPILEGKVRAIGTVNVPSAASCANSGKAPYRWLSRAGSSWKVSRTPSSRAGGAEVPQPLGVGVAGGGDLPQAAHERDLHRREADGSSGAVDEDRPPGREAERGEVQVGGVEGHRQGRRLGEVESGRNGELVIHDRVVGCARGLAVGPVGGAEDAVADGDVGDALADRIDGIFTVVGKPGRRPQADRLLDLLMDGLRPRGQGTSPAGDDAVSGRPA